MASELRPGPGPAALPEDLRPRFLRYAAFDYTVQLSTWLYDLPFLVLFAARSLSLEAVAVLGFGYKFAKDFLTYVYWPLIGVVTPVLARVRSRDSDDALRDAYASLLRLLGLVLIPAGAGLSLLTPRLIAALYPRYAEASGVATLFVAFVFAETLLHVAPLVMMTAERYRPVLLTRLLALLSGPALLWLMPRYGNAGAALAVGLVRLLPALAATSYVSRRMGLPLPLRFGGRLLAACLAFAVPLHLWLGSGPPPGFDPQAPADPFGLLPLAGFALAGAALFVLALKATGGLEAEDRRRVLALQVPGRVCSRACCS